MQNKQGTIDILQKKGVHFPDPKSVYIDPSVDPDRISGQGITIYPGCRLYGRETLILRNARLGFEGPATVENCQIGPDVQLKGGFFKDAVFLKGAAMGSGAHVRDATILEEQAGGAHTVGLKQTILLPFVTLGSLINFCDCLMAGGTSRRDHSEVGSSYIHFNYTPNQDKATASLIGDVPRGVMLNQRPIFLGGQGGLVGPCRLAFGTVTAAGSICRKDELRPNRLIVETVKRSANVPFLPGRYTGVKRILTNNLVYVANLAALLQWYAHVRARFVSTDFPDALLAGLQEKVQMGIAERCRRLGVLIQAAAAQKAHHNGSRLSEELRLIASDPRSLLAHSGDGDLRDRFIEKIDAGIERFGRDYIAVIKHLAPPHAEKGTLWLQGIVDEIENRLLLLGSDAASG